jgi:hypothetical protein
MAYDELRTLAFRFTPEYLEKKQEQRFYALAFPSLWKEKLYSLYDRYNNKNNRYNNLPVKSLNKSLRALVPDLISISPKAGFKKNNKEWLYSDRPIAFEPLRLIVKAWLWTEFSWVPEKELEIVYRSLSPGVLKWREKSTDIAASTTEKNGTAAMPHELFTVLPDFFAGLISAPGIELRRGAEIFRFYRSPLAPGKPGAELVSWPPQRTGENHLWSLTINLSLQTVPFQSYPVLNCNLGVRRWVTHPKLIGGGETSVALLTKVPWLRGLHQSNSFQVASLKWERNGDNYKLVWAENMPEILNKLQLQSPFPSPESIFNEPEKKLNLGGTPNAVVLYNTRMKGKHKVGAGLLPGDRHPFIEQIKEVFFPFLQLVDAPIRVKEFRGTNISNPFYENGHKSDEITPRIRMLLKKSLGEKIAIDIRYQSESVRDALTDAISNLLGVKPTELEKPLKTDEFTLTVKTKELGAVGDGFSFDCETKDFKKQLHKEMNKRFEEIRAAVLAEKQPRQGIIGTLIELDGERAYGDKKGEKKDPKHAMRLGFARMNRLTQFITPVNGDDSEKKKDSLPHRARMAVLDLFRQFGIQLEPRNKPQKGLPQSINYLGLWLVKIQGKTSLKGRESLIPVLLLMSSDRDEIKATAPGVDWVPYPEMLLKISQEKCREYLWKESDKIMIFVKEKLEEVTGKGDRDTLLICDAHNVRSIWKWVANTKIIMDKLVFTDESPRDIEDFPGLRVIRVRGGDETPQWYAQKGEEIGFTKGIFKISDNERCFASVYPKPKQQKNSSTYSSKIVESVSKSRKGNGKQYAPSPGTYAWNPVFYELTAACLQQGDEPWQWAAAAHELRNLAMHYDEPTALPLPIHLAKQVEEYTYQIKYK